MIYLYKIDWALGGSDCYIAGNKDEMRAMQRQQQAECDAAYNEEVEQAQHEADEGEYDYVREVRKGDYKCKITILHTFKTPKTKRDMLAVLTRVVATTSIFAEPHA